MPKQHKRRNIYVPDDISGEDLDALAQVLKAEGISLSAETADHWRWLIRQHRQAIDQIKAGQPISEEGEI